MRANDLIVGEEIEDGWTITSVEYALSNLAPPPPGRVFIADIVIVEMEGPAYPVHAPKTGGKRMKRTWFRISETIEDVETE